MPVDWSRAPNPPKPEPFEVSIHVTVEHSTGPVIEGDGPVLAWICADGQWPEGMRNGFTFAACGKHNPGEDWATGDCDCPEDQISTYKATIVSAERP